MRKLLREMVTTTTEYISSSTTAAGDFTTKASKATKTSLGDVDHSLSTTNNRIKAHTTAMTIKIEVCVNVNTTLHCYYLIVIMYKMLS